MQRRRMGTVMDAIRDCPYPVTFNGRFMWVQKIETDVLRTGQTVGWRSEHRAGMRPNL